MQTLRLVQNELIKTLFQNKKLILIMLFISMGILIWSTVSFSMMYPTDWKADTKGQIEQLEKQKEQKKEEKDGSGIQYYDRELFIKKESLGSNIRLESGMHVFLETAIATATLATIIFLVFSVSNNVAGEFKNSTLNLLLIRPVSRVKVLLSKYLSNLISALAFFSIVVLSALVMGILVFGFDQLTSQIADITTINSGVLQGYYWQKRIGVVILESLPFIFTGIAVSTFIGVLTKSTSLTSSITPILLYVYPTLWVAAMYTENLKLLKYLPIENIVGLGNYLISNPLPIGGMTKTSVLTLGPIYWIILLALPFIIFRRREV